MRTLGEQCMELVLEGITTFSELASITLFKEIFYIQFYVMIDAGLTINITLDILSNQVNNIKLRETLKTVSEDVQKGETLSASMNKHSDVFPNLLVKMVESGEASGAIDKIMLRMAK